MDDSCSSNDSFTTVVSTGSASMNYANCGAAKDIFGRRAYIHDSSFEVDEHLPAIGRGRFGQRQIQRRPGSHTANDKAPSTSAENVTPATATTTSQLPIENIGGTENALVGAKYKHTDGNKPSTESAAQNSTPSSSNNTEGTSTVTNMPSNGNRDIGSTAERRVSYVLHESVIERRGFGTAYTTFKRPVKPFDVTRPETLKEAIENLNTPAYWDWILAKYPPPPYVVSKVAYYSKPVVKYLEQHRGQNREDQGR